MPSPPRRQRILFLLHLYLNLPWGTVETRRADVIRSEPGGVKFLHTINFYRYELHASTDPSQ
jgi:hypothetical protein